MSSSFVGNKIRIKVRGFDIDNIEVAMRQIFNVVQQHNKDAKNANKELFTSGIFRLKRRHHVYSVLRAPNRHKDSQQHFESYEHKWFIDISNADSLFFRELNKINFSNGVGFDVEEL